MVAAFAAGALAAAGQGIPGGKTSPGQPTRLAAEAMAVPEAAPPPEVLTAIPSPDPAQIEALGEAVHRDEHSYTGPGVPYIAGNDEDLDGWIAQALGLMGLPQSLAPGIEEIIMHESRGDPDAINNYDSNAAAGTPSEGLMQVIPATFEACVLPSLADRDITDPVANITAGVRAMIANHGVDAVYNGGRRSSSGDYMGYGGAAVPSDDFAEEIAEDLAELGTSS